MQISERKDQLKKKRLCFNCTGPNHRASECRIKTGCLKCKNRHHTSICEEKPELALLASEEQGVIYPVVIVKVNGIKCRALLDTGAGSSYISAFLVNLLGKKPTTREYRQIDMMMTTTTKKIEVYHVKVMNLKGDFKLNVDVSKVDRYVLLSLKNPRYTEILHKYPHLQGVIMDDVDQKPELPVHLIIGAPEYARIKTDTKAKVGKPGEPVGELTRYGWTLISPGSEIDTSNMFYARTSVADYDRLCSLDVLGLAENELGENETVYKDFKDQLQQDPSGFYETGLLWKANCPPLEDNKSGSLARLSKLMQRLKKEPELFAEYEAIMKDQEEKGIIEEAKEEPKGKSFYLPHKPVVRKTAESTKVRIVYDASARANSMSASLNECLETGPALQNLIFDVLVRNRARPVILAVDIKEAFLQIRIRQEDRDVLRFHWVSKEDQQKIKVYRFTRALFGLNQSSFILGGTLETDLSNMEQEYPEEVKEIRRSIYVDDIILSGNTVAEMQELKNKTIKIFNAAGFELQKWHANFPELEGHQTAEFNTHAYEQSFAKQQFGVRAEETKLLGLSWKKSVDTIGIVFPAKPETITKRTVLQNLASIYDPLGIVSPITLSGKSIYRDICENKFAWDQPQMDQLLKRWNSWSKALPERIEIPRSLSSLVRALKDRSSRFW